MMLIPNTEEQAAYYRKEQKVYKYAYEFFGVLCKCGSWIMAQDKILPIYCYNEMEEFIKAVDKNCKIATSGGLSTCSKKQAVIRIGINGNNDILSAKLKRTIRHEIIHYFLWLHELPYRDNNIEFWCYCYAFDGGAYEKLSEEYQVLYSNFTFVYDSYIKNLPNNIKYPILNAAILNLTDSDITIEEYKNQVIKEINKFIDFFSHQPT